MNNNQIVLSVVALLVVGILVGFFFAWLYPFDNNTNVAINVPSVSTTTVQIVSPVATTTTPATKLYKDDQKGFSIVYPSDFTVDENYTYTNLGPTKTISGVKFTINPEVASGTNLSSDTNISVEQLNNASTTISCGANLFLDPGSVSVKQSTITEGGTTYSVLSSTGAGAGNRYEETVFAIPGSNPCTAVRYYIHYGAIDNYIIGTVNNFDKENLITKFDEIRHTLFIK